MKKILVASGLLAIVIGAAAWRLLDGPTALLLMLCAVIIATCAALPVVLGAVTRRGRAGPRPDPGAEEIRIERRR